jgi:hypothetical protein
MSWSQIEPDLRRSLAAAGKGATQIHATLAALEPVVRAVEAAGTQVDQELCWALLGVEADRQRRRCQARKFKKVS